MAERGEDAPQGPDDASPKRHQSPGGGGEGQETSGVAGGAEPTSEPPLAINAQYIKDLSFEAPNAPGIFANLQNQQPEIRVNIDVQAQPLRENTFEVTLHVNAECKADDQVAFIVELAYAGIFTLKIAQEHVQPVLLVECPRLLFPFVRYIVSDCTRDGGFPPLMIGPVDFYAMYQDQLRENAAQPANAATPADPAPGGGANA